MKLKFLAVAKAGTMKPDTTKFGITKLSTAKLSTTMLATMMACVLVSGCASSPPPVSYDNGSATPAQPNERIVNLNAQTLERQSYEQERNGLMQKIVDLGNELTDLKNKLQAKTPVAASIAEKPPVPAVPPVEATVAKKAKASKSSMKASTASGSNLANAATSGVPHETIVIQETGMVFRVMHGFAKTAFKPSKSLQQQLLQAARAGKRIEIRGRTDATAPNAVDREIALQRALNARVFLANNGIHPRKMQVNYMAAGDHVADNATAEGRARNRRVEIETAGIKPQVLEDLAAVIRHDLQ